VYFCCHPEDFGYLFESLSEEVLAEQNCAVWYAVDRNAPRDEAFWDDLSRMQLFVMPITAKLLDTPNAAIDAEFPFAIAHHIPVLPLMQESDLAEAFNRRCGDLQFLDKNVSDVTAIPYEEKLRAYLASVLVGDELAEKVRSAFDAYIFLSYRKKDRKHAHELMRLIHKNEFCRDIAIWYDEFLTPGENFNDAIRDALNKSECFVMTVTPNLVNEPNYVMTTEYPMAKKAGKAILPAEMVKTDREALTEKYDRLPALTDAHDEVALSETLLATLRALAIEENDNSPEHNFFIGLAYLGGIDVEVDHERAFSLITSSAEAGLPEAIDKLIAMYEKGEGVARSYESAVAWREKKIACSEESYRRAPSVASLHGLFWDVVDCGDAHKSLGRDALAREKYEYALNLLEASAWRDTDPILRRDLAVAYDRVGQACQSAGDYKGATPYYQKVLSLAEELCRTNPTERARLDLSLIYQKMGYPGFVGADAVRYREKAIAIAEEAVRETGTTAARQRLSDAYRFHGLMLKISGRQNLPAARECYEKALVIAEAVFCETGSLQARRNLADSYGLMGGIHGTLGEFDVARSYHEKEIRLQEAIAEETAAMGDGARLAGAYTAFAAFQKKVGDVAMARFYFEKSLALHRKLTAATDSVRYGESLVRAYDSLGDLYKGEGDIASACRYWEEGIAVREALCQRSDDPKYRYDIANAYCTIASLSPTKQRACLQKAIAIYEKLVQEYPDNDYYGKRLGAIRQSLRS
jgi:tetratricopeptide (TPR) repeat protein